MSFLFEKGFSVERLYALYEVAEKGSISAVAAGSASRQSLLSRQITELEQFFEVSLLNRESRPHRLTIEGSEMAGICREFFISVEGCRDRWHDRGSSVSIVSGESLLQWIVLPLMRERREELKTKKVRLSLRNTRTTEAVRSLLEGRADIGLIRKDAVPKGLKTVGDFEFRYELIIPESLKHGISNKGGASVLEGLPLAIPEGGGQLSRSIKEEAAAIGIDLDIQLECSSFPQIVEAISTMGMAGILPQFAPAIPNALSVEIPELNRLKRTLTLAWSEKSARIRPAITDAIKILSA